MEPAVAKAKPVDPSKWDNLKFSFATSGHMFAMAAVGTQYIELYQKLLHEQAR